MGTLGTRGPWHPDVQCVVTQVRLTPCGGVRTYSRAKDVPPTSLGGGKSRGTSCSGICPATVSTAFCTLSGTPCMEVGTTSILRGDVGAGAVSVAHGGPVRHPPSGFVRVTVETRK